MEPEPNQRVGVLGNCSEHPWFFSARLYLLQVQPVDGLGRLKVPEAQWMSREVFAGVFAGHLDSFGMTRCGVSPFLHSKVLGLIRAFPGELAWLVHSITEPDFCHQVGP